MILTLSIILYAIGTVATFIALGARYAPQTNMEGSERTIRDFYSIVIGLVWPVTLVWMVSSTFGERMVPVLEGIRARREVAKAERVQMKVAREAERTQKREAAQTLRLKKAQDKEEAREAKVALAQAEREAEEREEAATQARQLEEEAQAAQKAAADLMAKAAAAKAASNTGSTPTTTETSSTTVPDIVETPTTDTPDPADGNETGPFTGSTDTTTNDGNEEVVTPTETVSETTETPEVSDATTDLNRVVGPTRIAAYEGHAPTKAARRFASKHNVAVDTLVVEEVDGEEHVVAYLNRSTVEATS